MAYILYIVPIVLVLVIFVVSYFYCLTKYAPKKNKSDSFKSITPNAYQQTPFEQQQVNHHHYSNRIYEALGVSQQSNHPLGAIQATIGGRIRFSFFGLLFIAIALFGLYTFYFTDRDFFVPRKPLNFLIITVLLGGGIAYGLQLFYFSTRRILLRRTGFEIQSILGSKSYPYHSTNFTLTDTIEHKKASDGYMNLFNRNNFNRIWICRILFNDGHRPMTIKSSHYTGLRYKINNLIQSLTWVD